MRTNSTLDDIAPAIGYTATSILAVWYSGRRLYVPTSPRDAHPLRTLLGPSCFRALVRAYAGRELSIPSRKAQTATEREHAVVVHLQGGAGPESIAETLGVTVRRVRQIRAAVAANGLLDFEKNLNPADFLENEDAPDPESPRAPPRPARPTGATTHGFKEGDDGAGR